MPSESALPRVGRRLSSARLQRGLSQGTVARLAGIAPSYLSRIENGKIQPTFRTVLKIARALRAELDEIVGPATRNTGHKGPCPVTAHGRCLLDLIEPDDGQHRSLEERYTPREVKLLRRVASWIKSVTPDRMRAMEILMEDLTAGNDRRATS